MLPQVTRLAAGAAGMQAALAHDWNLRTGYARHAAWCMAGALLGSGVVVGISLVATAATQLSVATALCTVSQVLPPAILLLALLKKAVTAAIEGLPRPAPADDSPQNAGHGAAPRQTTAGAPQASSGTRADAAITAALGLSTGFALAPLAFVGLSGVGLAAAAFSGASAVAALAGHAAWHDGRLAQGFGSANIHSVAACLGTSSVGWSMLAGTAAGAALVGALAIYALGAAIGHIVVYHFTSLGGAAITPYADGFVVPDSTVKAHRADCLGEPSPTVFAVPQALREKLAGMRRNLRIDAEGRPYWLGMPVITLDGPPGTGKTALALAMAEKMQAQLIAVSASILNRVHLPGQAIGLLRALQIIAQAELRALRTGILQGVFIDEVGSLFPPEVDVTSAEGVGDMQSRLQAVLSLAVQNGRRNGVFIVLADNHVRQMGDGLLCFTPQPPIYVAPPARSELACIFTEQFAQMRRALTHKWRLPAGSLPGEEQVQALRAEVAALSAQGGVGRDAAGVVTRMRRAAEALFDDTDPAAVASHTLQQTMLTAGEGVCREFHQELVRTARQPLQPWPLPKVDADHVGSEKRGLLRRLMANPQTLLGQTLRMEAQYLSDPVLAAEYRRITNGFDNAADQIADRLFFNDAASAVLFVKKSRTAHDDSCNRLYASDSDRRAPQRLAPALDFYMDVTMPSYLECFVMARRGAAKLCRAESDPKFRKLDPHSALLVALRQRQAGVRRDAGRVELCA